MNHAFYFTAFSKKEQGQILETTLENADNAYHGSKGGSDTLDRVFLLSFDEAEEYLPDEDHRKLRATEYARQRGVYESDLYDNCCEWWLRSPGEDNKMASVVQSDGLINEYGTDVTWGIDGVRPAIWVIPDGDAAYALKAAEEAAPEPAPEADGEAAPGSEALLGSWHLVSLRALCDQGLGYSHSLDVSTSLHLHDGTGTHLTFGEGGALDTDIDVASLIEESPKVPFDIPPLSILGDSWRSADGQVSFLPSGDTYSWSVEDGKLKLLYSGTTMAYSDGNQKHFKDGEGNLEVELGFLPIEGGDVAPAQSAEAEPEPEAEPEVDDGEPAEGEASIDEVLDALDRDVYRDTYAALLAGEVVEKGSKGDAAKGVQQTLVDLGQDIAVDGSVGPKTISALNDVQAALGLEQTESVDAKVYEELLKRLLMARDPEEAEMLLKGSMDDGEFDYMLACACEGQGKFYTAKQLFEQSGWGDWEERAAACVQPWPKTGRLYKNPNVGGSATELIVKFNTDPDTAMLVKIYTEDDVLARTLFIGGTGQASTKLPAGTYVIKDGRGHDWYGEAEAFGDDGSYEIMTFGDGEQTVTLKANYSTTITVNVQEDNPDADSVGSDWEDWSNF